MSDQNSYWVITSRAKGDANSPFGGSATSNQTSQLVQMTEDQIRQEYQDSGQLQDKFGSFDSYMGYINDSQEFVQSAEWMTANPEYRTGSKEWAFLNGEDLSWKPGEREQIQQKIIQDRTAARTSAFEQWMGGEAGSALMEKYGIEPLIYNDDGDKFKWTGSGYQKTYKVDDHLGPADYGKMLIAAGIGAGATPAIAGALGGIGGAALPAGVAGPSAPLLSSGVAKGLAAGATSAASQGLLTGSIDPKQVLAAGVIGGFAPGEVLADKVGDTLGLSAPGNPFNPDSFGYGAVSGAGNSAVGQLITDGSIDIKDVAQAGLLSGAINAVRDTFDDSNYYTQEEIAQRYLAQGYTADEAWRLAGESPLLNTSDLGALVGDGGLLPFIPRAPIGFIDAAETLLTGAGAYAELPDGTKIPLSVYDNQAPYKFTGEDGNTYVGNGSDRMMELGAEFNETGTPGLFSNPVVNTVLSPIGGLLTSGQAELSDQQQAVYDASKAQAEALYSDMDDGVAKTVAINNATQSAFNNYYAHFHGDDGLDENYTVAPNPRGNGEIIGATFQGYDDKGEPLYTTGTINYEQLADGSWIPSTLSAITESANNAASSNQSNSSITSTSDYNPATYQGYTPDPNLAIYLDGAGGTLPVGDTNQDFENWLLVNSILGDDEFVNGTVPGGEGETNSTASTTASESTNSTTSNNVDAVTANTSDTVASTDTIVGGDLNTGSGTNSNDLDTTVINNDVLAGANNTTVIDTNSVISGTDDLTSGTSSSGGGGLSIPSDPNKGLPVLWGMLDPYTKFRGYAKKRQDLYSKMMKAFDAKDSSGMLSSRSTILTPRERELFEAGEFKR